MLWAELDYKRGSETAMTNRLIGKAIVSVEIRDTPLSRGIDDAWRFIIIGQGPRGGEAFNVRSVLPSKNIGFFNIVAESGVANG